MSNTISQRMISVMLHVEPRMLHDLLRLVLAHKPMFQVVQAPERAPSPHEGDDAMTQTYQLPMQQTPLDWLVVSLTDRADLPAAIWHRIETARPSALLALGDDGDYAEIWVKSSQKWVRKYTIKAISLTVLLAILRYTKDRLLSATSLCGA